MPGRRLRDGRGMRVGAAARGGLPGGAGQVRDAGEAADRTLPAMEDGAPETVRTSDPCLQRAGLLVPKSLKRT